MTRENPQLRFDSLDDENGLDIWDLIENRQLPMYTPREVSPVPATTDEFAYPVSAACAISTERITLPYTIPTVIRDSTTGTQISDGQPPHARELDPASYLIELITTPIKLYLRVDAAVSLNWDDDQTRFEFDGPTRVKVGARSFHTAPAETIVVPDDPSSILRAISTFGSALKTTTCERSWPTLRGHPPRLRRGDELSIPDGLEPPDTGVTLRVPPDYDSLYPIATLAYYLGAEVVPHEDPRLITDAGFSYDLGGPNGFEDEVIRVLKQAFLFDCAVRTEGYFQTDLYERQLLESNPEVDVDFAALYDAPLAEQLETYLSVPFSVVADAVPTWDRIVYTRPTATGVEALPFVVNDFSIVRVRSPRRTSAADRSGEGESIASFKRIGTTSDTGRRGVPGRGQYVPLPESDALERGWVGDGTPVHGSKLLPDAFERDPSTSTSGAIDVTVVCNDEQMREEWDSAARLYGNRDVVRFETDRRFGVSVDELRDLLVAGTDLLHFVGHIDGRGFECPDGVLDATTLDEVGAKTVLLNGCRSHDQGIALVDAGARAAIVTLADVGNLGAVEVGETLVRLLNYGFPVGSAVAIAEEYTALGHHYVTLGDPGARIVQCEDGAPALFELSENPSNCPPDENVAMTTIKHTVREYPMGSVGSPIVREDDDPTYYVTCGPAGTVEATASRIEQVLGDESSPYVVDDELTWSDELFAGGTSE